MKKKLVSSLLSAALLAGMLAAPAGAARFPDVADPQAAEAVEVLGQLGIVNGKPDGTFDPAGSFTRAEFCKMALVALDREEEAQSQAGRVIFADVTADHWALGYVNAAAAVREGSSPLVQGKGNGRFEPDAPITCGEAVTILMRSLGYTDKDVGGDGGSWYAGHMRKALSVGLLEGLEGLSGTDTLTRAQAALLFENLLYTETKDSEDIFLKTALGGSVADSELILEVKGKALSAGGWTVKTDRKNYVTYRDALDPAFQGKRCKLVLDREGNVLSLQADEDYTTRVVRILSAEARYVRTEDDRQILVPSSTPVWRADQDQKDYAAAYKEIANGAAALFCYDKADTLVSIYLTGDSSSAVTAVAKEGSRPFEGAWETTPTAVYKNGVAVSLAAVKPYDVGTFDSRTGVLEVSDRKLTGIYENATPSPVSPNTITLMGCDSLPVLDCALQDLSAFHLGDQVTLLLDGSNRVAGVVSPSKTGGKVLGLATITKGEPDSRGRDTYTAQVATAYGLTLKGDVRVSDQGFAAAPGKLYAVTSSRLGVLDLTTPSSAPIPGDWDVVKGSVGPHPVSPRAAVYEKTAGGVLAEVGMDAVRLSTVPARKITFLHLDGAGSVDAIVLEDVTGDSYRYGLVEYTAGSLSSSGMVGGSDPAITLTSRESSLRFTAASNFSSLNGKYVGISPAILPTSKGDARPDTYCILQPLSGVSRTDFSEDSVLIGGVSYPLATNIDDCCYNAVSETWFSSLDDILAYASQLTVYYDKLPSQGGKVRMVVVE